jgi:hypothetical protein
MIVIFGLAGPFSIFLRAIGRRLAAGGLAFGSQAKNP